jgi:ribosomal protein S12 methylthiotransferase
LTTPSYTAYIKIAEGCNNCCTYCIIPRIRGPYRSRPMESILDEASELANKCVKEIILIAQDTTRYGEDLYGKNMLPDLIRRLCRIEKIHWIRCLYSYPEKISTELLEAIESEPKVCNYLDIPIQHIDDTILKRMNRQSSAEGIRSLIDQICQREADFILRTTLIVGFPGEDATAFRNLLQFVQENPFDRMGVFSYSQEEGTLASKFPD